MIKIIKQLIRFFKQFKKVKTAKHFKEIQI